MLFIPMDYNKTALDYPQIITLLKRRNLLFANETVALKQLQIISYFRLANYLRPMEQDKVSHIFKPNSYFENAIDLYYFDKQLRALLFTAIQSFEVALRSKIIHHFSLRYVAFWFLNQDLFSDKRIFSECLTHIQQEVLRSKEDFIQEHLEKYDNPPLPPAWKTLEVVSFGTLSRVFCNFSDVSLKKKIARELNLPQHRYLESWCKSLVALRNNLAHHSRTWNRTFPIQPQLPRTLNGEWIEIIGVPSNKLYAQLCCLAYLQNAIHPGNDFKQSFRTLLDAHQNVDVSAMGFPSNWESQPLWKIQ